MTYVVLFSLHHSKFITLAWYDVWCGLLQLFLDITSQIVCNCEICFTFCDWPLGFVFYVIMSVSLWGVNEPKFISFS